MEALAPLFAAAGEAMLSKNRTSAETMCLHYVKELLTIVEEYKNVYKTKRGSKTWARLIKLEIKLMALMDFYKHDVFAGTYLVLQIKERELTTTDVLYAIATPRSNEKTKDDTIAAASKALNMINAILLYAPAIKSDVKLAAFFKGLSIAGDAADATAQAAEKYRENLQIEITATLEKITDNVVDEEA